MQPLGQAGRLCPERGNLAVDCRKIGSASIDGRSCRNLFGGFPFDGDSQGAAGARDGPLPVELLGQKFGEQVVVVGLQLPDVGLAVSLGI